MNRNLELLIPFTATIGGSALLLIAQQFRFEAGYAGVALAVVALAAVIAMRPIALLKLGKYILPLIGAMVLFHLSLGNIWITRYAPNIGVVIITAAVIGILYVYFFRGIESYAQDFDLVWLNTPAEGTEFSDATKKEIYEAADGKCEACHCNTILGNPNSRLEAMKMAFRGFAIGHIHHCFPRSKGGKGIIENGCLLCAKCNWRLGDKLTWLSFDRLRKHGAMILTKSLWPSGVSIGCEEVE